MADDLRDTFGEDVFLDAEEEEIEEEGGEKQNRTFLIGVALLGSLLLLAIGAFVVWALVLNPRQAERQADMNAQIIATNEAVLIAMQQTQTVEAMPTETPTATPTQVVEPTATPTPVIRATNTPTPEDDGEDGENGDTGATGGTPVGEGTATVSPRRTETPRPVTPAAPSTLATTPDTGFGEVLLIAAAGLFMALIVFARRLRRA